LKRSKTTSENKRKEYTMETELDKRSIEDLKRELASREKHLGITKQREVVQRLKEKETKIKGDFAVVLRAGKDDEKLRRSLKEIGDQIWEEERRLEGLRSNQDEKVSALASAVAAKKREFAERESGRILEQVEALRKELIAKVQKLVCLAALWDKSNPTKLIRAKSRPILIRKRAVLGPDFPLPPGNGYLQKEVMLHRLPDFLRDGWEVFPEGQDLTLEPLSNANAFPIKTFQPPEPIAKIQNLQIEIDTFSAWGSQGEADQMIKVMEKEIDGNGRAI
jgi:hypothetical protein